MLQKSGQMSTLGLFLKCGFQNAGFIFLEKQRILSFGSRNGGEGGRRGHFL